MGLYDSSNCSRRGSRCGHDRSMALALHSRSDRSAWYQVSTWEFWSWAIALVRSYRATHRCVSNCLRLCVCVLFTCANHEWVWRVFLESETANITHATEMPLALYWSALHRRQWFFSFSSSSFRDWLCLRIGDNSIGSQHAAANFIPVNPESKFRNGKLVSSIPPII